MSMSKSNTPRASGTQNARTTQMEPNAGHETKQSLYDNVKRSLLPLHICKLMSLQVLRFSGATQLPIKRTGETAIMHNVISTTHPLPNRPRRPVPRKKAQPTTPHAIRALQQRNAAASSTPGGRFRRHSGRQQRETPRDILRNLTRGMHHCL